MKEVRMLVVDDSPFIQTVVKRALEGTEFQVCGTADTGREGLAAYEKLQPELVLMDVTMPDMDGLSCSRKIMELNREAAIVILSSMGDENIVAQAQSIGVKAYLQKPVKGPDLLEVLRRVCQDVTEENWQETYVEQFCVAFQENLRSMGGMNCEKPLVWQKEKGVFASQGVAIVVGLTSRRDGRVILDTSPETAKSFAQRMFGRDSVTEKDIHHGMAELANIVCGHGVTKINNRERGTELRLSPPSIFFGTDLGIINPKLQSYVIKAETEIGVLVLNVGFAGGNGYGRKNG